MGASSDPIDVRELRGVKFSMDVKNPQGMTSGANQADQGALTAAAVGDLGNGAAGASSTGNFDKIETAIDQLVADAVAVDKLLTEIRTTLVANGMMKGSA